MTGAAIIGTGFIAGTHLDALRRLGIPVRGVLGSSPSRGEERARAMGVPRAYASLDDLLGDPEVEVVHVTSPNHLHHPQVMAILEAGRHVVCEKPLAMTSAQSAEMVRAAEASGRVCAVCYNTRFYPLNQHAHGMVAGGELGDVRLVTGGFLQDWLARDTDWNWRLEPEEGGDLRAVGDIGTHWLDLTSFIAGMQPSAVMAELATSIPVRRRPTGPVETFSAAVGETEPVEIRTEDVGIVMLRYPNGARGVMTVSQVSHGHKGGMAWEIAGSEASARWDAEASEALWIGHRGRANETLWRDPSLMNPTGARAAYVPGGHVEGFPDSFRAFFAQVYADIAAGGRRAGATWATFADGHHSMILCDAILESARRGSWVEVAP
jgi:predicted dehydrogenase